VGDEGKAGVKTVVAHLAGVGDVVVVGDGIDRVEGRELLLEVGGGGDST